MKKKSIERAGAAQCIQPVQKEAKVVEKFSATSRA